MAVALLLAAKMIIPYNWNFRQHCWRSMNASQPGMPPLRFLSAGKALSKLFRAALQQSEFLDQIPTAVWQQDWNVTIAPLPRHVAQGAEIALG